MGFQLIFVVEANAKCKSDWIYIKNTIEHFYQYDRTQIKFSPVYMDGKGKYQKKENEILRLISQYASVSQTNQSKVIYCFDCDDYDSKSEDSTFLRDAQKYCMRHEAEFVWFCKDIELVYLGKKVDKSNKKTESAAFTAKKRIMAVNADRLSVTNFRPNTSNILNILDKYLTRKKANGSASGIL